MEGESRESVRNSPEQNEWLLLATNVILKEGCLLTTKSSQPSLFILHLLPKDDTLSSENSSKNIGVYS